MNGGTNPLESPDVYRVRLGNREIILIATAHVSRESAVLVQQAIKAAQPDSVCVELDEARHAQLRNQQRFESLDLKQVIRQQQLLPLLVNLLLVSYQQKLGGKLGVLPGSEFIAAIEEAERQNVRVMLCDRNIKVTLRRAWAALTWCQEFMLLAAVLGSAFETPDLTEEDLRHMREQDIVTRLIEELGRELPGLSTVLIDERDHYLAERIRQAPGDRVLAVVGAGHVKGILQALTSDHTVDLASLETIPPSSAVWQWLAWSMPAVIIAAIAWIGWQHGVTEAGNNILFWVLITGVPSMLATLLAAAHPLTALSALVSAPITTLSPILGVGYIAAFVEAYVRPPRVYELRNSARDVSSLRQWWTNRLLRILLVFVLSSLGGSAGMLIGSAEIIRNLFR